MEPLFSHEVFEEFRHYILPSSENTPCRKNKPYLTFPEDVICPKNVDRIRSFFKRADSLDKRKLNDVLEELDRINRVDPRDPEIAAVSKMVVTFVEQILQRVEEIDSRFHTTLLRGGSFYDGVKIGKPDEFDFTAKIEKLCTAQGLEGRFSAHKKGFVYLVVKKPEFLQDFKEFIIEAENDAALEKSEHILSVRKIGNYFSELVNRALRSIEAPGALTPSEEKHGISWHSVHCGPCATVRATYHSILDISIDIAPTFDLHMSGSTLTIPALELGALPCFPDTQSVLLHLLCEAVNQRKLKVMVVPFAFDKIVENTAIEGPSWSYKYSDTWRVSFNSMEKFIFSRFEFNSVEKQLYRVLKILKGIFIQNTEGLKSQAGSRDLKLEEPPSTVVAGPISVEFVGFVSSFSVATNFVEEQNDETDDETEDEASSDSMSGHGEECEVLYDRSSFSSSDIREQSATGNENPPGGASFESVPTGTSVDQLSTSPENDFKVKQTQECHDAKPLIKTYLFKMLFFLHEVLTSRRDAMDARKHAGVSDVRFKNPFLHLLVQGETF